MARLDEVFAVVFKKYDCEGRFEGWGICQMYDNLDEAQNAASVFEDPEEREIRVISPGLNIGSINFYNYGRNG